MPLDPWPPLPPERRLLDEPLEPVPELDEPEAEPREAMFERDEPLEPIRDPDDPELDPLLRSDRSPSSLRLDMPSAQPVTWSLRLLIWSLIWLRRDHRNTPAPTAAAAAAAVAIGRSLAVSIQPLLYWLLPLGLLLRPPRLLLFLAISFLHWFVSLSICLNERERAPFRPFAGAAR
jgi:hypothetical protein